MAQRSGAAFVAFAAQASPSRLDQRKTLPRTPPLLPVARPRPALQLTGRLRSHRTLRAAGVQHQHRRAAAARTCRGARTIGAFCQLCGPLGMAVARARPRQSHAPGLPRRTCHPLVIFCALGKLTEKAQAQCRPLADSTLSLHKANSYRQSDARRSQCLSLPPHT